MRRWTRLYWDDLKGFLRSYGLVLILLLGSFALLQYAVVIADAKDDHIQELERYTKLLEEEKIQMLEAFDELLEVETQLSEECERLQDENQILGSYLAEYDVQYEQ